MHDTESTTTENLEREIFALGIQLAAARERLALALRVVDAARQHEQLRLLAERGTLQKMIAEIPPDDVLDLASLEARLAQVNHLLANFRLEPEPVLRGYLDLQDALAAFDAVPGDAGKP